MAAPPPPARGSSRQLWTILTAVAVVALLLVVGAAYGIAGYVTAGNRLTTANRAIDTATSHRAAFDNAPSTFDIERSDAKAFQSDAAAWVQTWTTQSTTIASDDATLTAAGGKLRDQQWLTVIRRGSLDSASGRIDHAHKAMDAAKTIAIDRQAEGKFLVAYANFLNDIETFITKEQGGDALGALATASQLPADADKAMSLSGDPQFPSELGAYMRSVATVAKDLVDYLNAVTKGDTATASSLQAKTNDDINAGKLIDISQVPTKVDQFYQPYIDAYHKELALAGGS
ncbi:MAG TPA: hypothetical protein VEQ13_00940 [Methylomirabilota bacterium]|nr:hypothetical protein [Methylomirabilota bacterium]